MYLDLCNYFSFPTIVIPSPGSSVSTNLGPSHLINVTTLAERQNHIEWLKLPQQLYFNRGCLEEALRGIADSGEKRALVVTDKGMVRSGILQRVLSCLRDQGLAVEVFSEVYPDPNMECIRKGVAACNSFQPDVMICLGGGSPIDAGKFIRVQYEHPEVTLEDASARFIEIRKRTCPFPKLGSKIAKLVAIPTTSGTGSEVSPFTVITSDEGQKYPIASYKLTPQIAICDSTLCDSLPKSLVAHAGLDSITHATEAFVSVASNDFTKDHALGALELLFKYLPESYKKGSIQSRDACHRGATIAGIAFANSFLGICHSLAHKVGAQFHLPHGLTCAILLPHVVSYNADERPTKMGIYPSYLFPQAAERYGIIAKHIRAPTPDADGLNCMIRDVMREVEAPLSFQEAGINEIDFLNALDDMAANAFDDQCTGTNPRYPLVGELKEILIQAYYGNVEEEEHHPVAA
jgi:acetaldehyde dehydrogenase/alcohol dehydrogenase